ncbi:MAG: FG-GAP-like repeat-containing protein, partial [Bacteroidota bacterium]
SKASSWRGARLFLFTIVFLLGKQSYGQFSQIAGAKGLDDATGSRVNGHAWGDINEDGYLDVIFHTNAGGNDARAKLLVNMGPPNYDFRDTTATLINGFNTKNTYGRQLLIVDFNNDGYNDILRGFGSGRNIEIYFNDGPPNYTFGDASQNPDVYIGAPGDGQQWNTEGVAAVDWNQDGWLDIIVDNDGGGNDVYENDQAGGFTYISPGTSLGQTGFPASHSGDGDYMTAADIDNNGYVDLYGRKTAVSNYWWFNPSTSQFETQANPNIVSNEGDKGGTMFCDFDNDGDLDLFWTANGTNQIWRNDGNNVWTATGIPGSPIDSQSDIDGCDCGDYDNDGDLDIILGAASGNSYLLENTTTGGTLSFSTNNLATNANTESVTFTDFDNDGDLDLFFIVDGAANQLWENTTNNSDYLFVNALFDNGNNSTRDAIGANVFLTTCDGDTSGMRQVNGGKGHGSQHQKKVHFGLDPSLDYIVEVHYVYNNGIRRIVKRAVTPSGEINQEISIRDTDSNDITACDPDSDGDGIVDSVDLDDDNDGIPDTEECPGLGVELVVNGDFEDAYAHWTADFNRGSNNNAGTSGGCGSQGWVAVTPCATKNGICTPYFSYSGSTPDGSVLITDAYGTGANIISTTNCNQTANSCFAQILPDHTTGTGLSVYIDPSDETGKAYWQQTITVEAGKTYQFSAWLMVIEEDPNLEFKIAGSSLTGGINLDRLTGGSNGTDEWQEVSTNWSSGATSGNVVLELVNLTGGCSGNDIRLDDVSFREVLSSCDADGDGQKDYLDLDSDNDGIPDIIEAGGTDTNGDGLVDYPIPGDPTSMTDADEDGLFDDVDESVSACTLVANYTGSFDSGNSSGITNGTNVDGGIDGSYAEVHDGSDILTIDLSTALATDDFVIITWRRKPSYNNTGSSTVNVQESASAGSGYATTDAITYTAASGGQTDWQSDTVYVVAGTRYIRLENDGAGGQDFQVDAIIATDQTCTSSSGTPLDNPDTDGDGITDAYDLDADNDGIPDIIEAGGVDSDGDGKVDDMTDADEDGFADVYDPDDDGTSGIDSGEDGQPLVETDGSSNLLNGETGISLDSDGDGFPDHLDLDADNDGIPDLVEAGGVDTNGDGLVDDDTDADEDGFADIFDTDDDSSYGIEDTNDALLQTAGTDTDGDGKADDAAITFLSGDGDNADTDGDGLPDHLDLDADNDGITDLVEAGGIDTDGDGLVDNTTDADNDGYADIFDTDDDGTAGVEDANDALLQTAGTDTDGDGKADDAAITYQNGEGSNADTDGDGFPDHLDLDADNDGITDLVEAGGVDTDGDGLVDNTTDADNDGYADIYDTDDDGTAGVEDANDALLQTAGTDTDGDGKADDAAITYQNGEGVDVDTDSDGFPDHLDLDADNDGITDLVEAGGVDTDGDGLVDNTTDADNDGYADIFDTDDDGTAGVEDANDALLQTAGTDTDADGKADDAAISYQNGDGADSDTDGDGFPDHLDLDADNDGIPDLIEAGGSDADGNGIVDDLTDADNDGYADVYDTDDDGTAGVEDATDALVQTGGTDTDADGKADDAAISWANGSGTSADWDGDGIVNHLDLDGDNDGIPDIIEAGGVDTDGDGIADGYTDADNDGFNDVYDPTDNDSDSGNDASFTANANTPLVQTDADGNSDGIVSGAEGYAKGDLEGDNFPNFLDLDADNDGILDIVEADGPSADTNGDGYVDDYNPGTGTFSGAGDADSDGYSNEYDSDTDNDATPDNTQSLVAGRWTGGPLILTGADGDNNGTPDSYGNGDSDGDVHPNFIDVDADNDGILDFIEAQATGQSGTQAFVPNQASFDAKGVPTPFGSYDNYDTDNSTVLSTSYGIDPYDHDGDGTPDYLDTDSDNDGDPDIDEAWDTNLDGNGSVDYSCAGVDADGDGLLSCFDADDAASSTNTNANNPPVDNAYENGLSNGATSASTFGSLDGSSVLFYDVFPNNSGDSGDIQPDWRDNNSGCTSGANLVYPITGTDAIFNGSIHTNNPSAVSGSIRASDYCVGLVQAGWTYYFDPINPSKVLFAINHGANTTQIDFIEMRRDITNARNNMDAGNGNGYFVMPRDWFVSTVDDAALTAPVDIRFYFDPVDSTAMVTKADSFATAEGLTLGTLEWFKTDAQFSNGTIESGNGLSNAAGYTAMTPAGYGTESGLHYVQFDGITGFSGGGLGIGVETPFPVEMLHFEAKQQGKSAMLNWSTATESNSDLFRVERSFDGQHFAAIGDVKAAGNSNSTLNYQFEDPTAFIQGESRLYYRLKQVDLDGQFAYSNIEQLTMSSRDLLFLEAFPNPADKRVSLLYTASESGPLQLKIISGLGQIVQTKTLMYREGAQKLEVDLSSWAAGIYYIQLEDENKHTAYFKLFVK